MRLKEADLDLLITDKPSEEDSGAILAALRQYTRQAVGVLDNHDFGALLKNPETGLVVGGLVAQSRWGSFQIDMIVVPDEARGQGLGSQLLSLAEKEARRRGCHHMWLDTYAFQARAFYKRLGFEVFGQLDGPEPFYPRYFMRKLIA